MQRHAGAKRPQVVVNKKQHAGYASTNTKPECASPGEMSDKPGHSETHPDAEYPEYEKEDTHILRGTEAFQSHQRYYGHNDGSIQRLKRK